MQLAHVLAAAIMAVAVTHAYSGVDLSTNYGSVFSCLVSNGYNFAIIRAYEQVGQPDPVRALAWLVPCVSLTPLIVSPGLPPLALQCLGRWRQLCRPLRKAFHLHSTNNPTHETLSSLQLFPDTSQDPSSQVSSMLNYLAQYGISNGGPGVFG